MRRVRISAAIHFVISVDRRSLRIDQTERLECLWSQLQGLKRFKYEQESVRKMGNHRGLGLMGDG